ncbi:hypothetical protein [Endothiovibrio diazotrophicus]
MTRELLSLEQVPEEFNEIWRQRKGIYTEQDNVRKITDQMEQEIRSFDGAEHGKLPSSTRHPLAKSFPSDGTATLAQIDMELAAMAETGSELAAQLTKLQQLQTDADNFRKEIEQEKAKKSARLWFWVFAAILVLLLFLAL